MFKLHTSPAPTLSSSLCSLPFFSHLLGPMFRLLTFHTPHALRSPKRLLNLISSHFTQTKLNWMNWMKSAWTDEWGNSIYTGDCDLKNLSPTRMGEAKPTAQPQLNKHRFSEWRRHCEWSHVVFLWNKIQLSVDSHIKRKQQIYTHLILSAPSPDVDLHSCLPVCLNIFQDDFTTCKPETSYNVLARGHGGHTHTHTNTPTDVPPPILISCECMCVSPTLFTSTSLNALAVCGREGFRSLWALRS